MIGHAPKCVAACTTGAPGAQAQEAIGGARDACGLCRGLGDGVSAAKAGRNERSEKITSANEMPAGMTAGALLSEGRQSSHSLLCWGGGGLWPPAPSAEQMTANGSKPKWPAGMMPESSAAQSHRPQSAP